jgi:integrase/recombinase XerD
MQTIIIINEHYQGQTENYYRNLQTLGYVHQSVKNKTSSLKEFFNYISTQGIQYVKSITASHIKEYQKFLEERPGKTTGEPLSETTIYSHLGNLSQYFSMLQSKGEILIHPCSLIKRPPKGKHKERKVLTQAEIKTLHEHTASAQERAILSLAYGCGLRAAEMKKLNTEDIKLREGILIVLSGKGNKRRAIPLSKGVIMDLSNYYYNEREPQSEKEKAYMLHSKGGRMKEYTYNKLLKRMIIRTKNKSIIAKGITLHHLRHSIATHLLEQGVEIEKVKQFLGHSLLETTQIYARVNQNQLKQLI